MIKTEVLGMTLPEMESFMRNLGEQAFRGRQIYRWIYKNNVSSFFDMTDLPKDLRLKLAENAGISVPKVIKGRISKDGTRKFLLELNDRKRIETVVIPQLWRENERYTACISSQVGCPLGCAFCATGHSGFERDLAVYEIVGQVIAAEREIRRRERFNHEDRAITNIVFMGMGEPLLNLKAVLPAISLINHEKGINIGQRKITISTVGIISGIEVLKNTDLQVTLAVSLHATTNEVRDRIIPLNRKYPLEQLIKSLRQYTDATGRRVTLEYLLLDGVNTGGDDARRLAQIAHTLNANVNLIPYNRVEECDYRKPEENVIFSFYQILEADGVNVTLRQEMGADIEAACGQLRGRRPNRNNSKKEKY